MKTELYNLIKYHNKLYWIDNNPIISDDEYDSLVNKYISLGGKLEDFNIIPPQIENSNKYEHKIPMLSLDKAYSMEEVLSWGSKICRSPNEELLIQPKFDGWACKIINNNNSLKLVTRGDGYIGDDITNKISLINIPKIVYDYPITLGEIVLLKSKFNKYKHLILRDNGLEYKTTRSALAGLLSTKELKVLNINEPILDFMMYDLYTVTKSYNQLSIHDYSHIVNAIKDKDYPTDGAVFKLKDINYYTSLGSTSHHPRGAIALKFGNPKGISKLINVEWFIGKNNTINPVGIIEPVIIAGHEIRRVNLHNAQNIIDKNIKINDNVVIQRCGEIIPDLIEVIPSENRQNIILNKCPSCSSIIKYEPPFLYCTNPECSGSLLKKLTDSCVRLGIDNIGKGTISKLINIGIENIYDILTINKYSLYELEGFAETSVNNLYNEIQKIKTEPIEDWKILSCLNINGIGDELSRLILKTYTFDELLNLDNLEDFIKIPKLSNIRAYELFEGLTINVDLIIDLLNTLNVIETKNEDSEKLNICFTGKMKHPRSYYENLAEKNNYHCVSSISKDLDLLVTSDLERQSSKINKARKLGIQIITVNEFLKSFD